MSTPNEKNTLQPPAPYIARSDLARAQASAARLADDGAKFIAFKLAGNQLEVAAIDTASRAREMGLSFQEYYLPPKSESARVYFQTHYAEALRMSFDQFQWFIQISKKQPDAPLSMADAFPVLQLALFAGDFIDLPLRTEAQQSHEQTPYTCFFKTLRGLQTDLGKRLEDSAAWDQSERALIKKEIVQAREFLSNAERQLA